MPSSQNNFYLSNNSNNNNMGKLSNKEAFQEQVLGSRKFGIQNIGPDFSKMLGDYEQFQKNKNALFKKYEVKRLEEELKATKEGTQERLEAETKLQDTIRKAEEEALLATAKFHENTYKRMNAAQKVVYLKTQSEELEATRKRVMEEYDLQINSIIGYTNEDNRLREQLQQEKLQKFEQFKQEESRIEDEVRRQQSAKTFKELKATEDNYRKFKESPSLKGALNLMVGVSKVDSKRLEEMYKDSKEAYKNQKDLTLKHQEDFRAMLADENLTQEERAKLEKERQDQLAEDLKKENQLARQQIATYIADSFVKGVDEKFNQVEEIFSEYKGIIDARLQGSDKNFDDMMNLISSNLLLSPYMKTQKLIDNMKRLADEGVAYNIEQRAFLNTISEKIAKTFDAFDSNLQRLIRLQQSDSTAARLGMEASLTKLFNNMFQDSSYLNSIADSVSSAIIDASSTMSRDMSTAFEFQVQKWLGSLSSLGMSESTITNLAQGINYLATGDVTSLSNNTQLQTLFAMSAANAGLEYSELLLKGLDASNINKLMESMVKYLKEIAEGSDNQVVRAAYGNIFSMSMSDMRAIANLSAGDISNIASKTLSYSAAMAELNSQLNQVSSRTTLTEKMNNLYNNVLFNFAENIVSDPAMYPMYKILKFMKEQDVDINIPTVMAAGFGLDLETTVGDLMRGALMAGSALKMIPDIFRGLTSGGGLNLGSWKAAETTSRGSGTSFVDLSARNTTSSSTYISSGNVTDIKSSTLLTATEEAEETSKITNKNIKKVEHTIDDVYDIFNPIVSATKPEKFIWVKDYTIAELMDGDTLKVKDTTVNSSIKSLEVSVNNLNKNTFKVVDVDRSTLLNSISNLSTSLNSVTATAAQASSSSSKVDINDITKAISNSLKTSIKVENGQVSITEILQMLYNIMGGKDATSIKVRPDTGATFNVINGPSSNPLKGINW